MSASLRQNLADGLQLRSPLQAMFVAGVGIFLACLAVGLAAHVARERTLPGILLHYLEEGDTLFAAGDFDAAVVAYRTAALLSPDDLEALLRLHAAADRIGDTESVWWSLRRAVALVPDDGRVLYWLGEAYFDDGKPQAALDAFERAFAVVPSAELAYRIGLVYRQQADSTKAIQWLERALELDPAHTNARAYLNMLQGAQR